MKIGLLWKPYNELL